MSAGNQYFKEDGTRNRLYIPQGLYRTTELRAETEARARAEAIAEMAEKRPDLLNPARALVMRIINRERRTA